MCDIVRSRRKLRPAEMNILAELAEPNLNSDNAWYFPAKNLRTLWSLNRLGLAKPIDSDHGGYGYSITKSGRGALKTGSAG